MKGFQKLRNTARGPPRRPVAQRFTFLLAFPPDEMVLDENYDILRILTPAENPPTLERLLTAQNVVVVPPFTGSGRYREAIKKFAA